MLRLPYDVEQKLIDFAEKINLPVATVAKMCICELFGTNKIITNMISGSPPNRAIDTPAASSVEYLKTPCVCGHILQNHDEDTGKCSKCDCRVFAAKTAPLTTYDAAVTYLKTPCACGHILQNHDKGVGNCSKCECAGFVESE